MDINPINIELLSVFLHLHASMKRLINIACFEWTTSFSGAITVYTMKTWALGGVWGLGEGNYHIKNMKNFWLPVDFGQFVGRGYIVPPPNTNRVNVLYMMDINPIHIELLSEFSRLHTQMKRVCIIACFDSSTSCFEAISKIWKISDFLSILANL